MKPDRGTLPITSYDRDTIPVPYSWTQKKEERKKGRKVLTVTKFKKAIQMLAQGDDPKVITQELHLSQTVVSQINRKRITLITDEHGNEELKREI